MNRKDFFIMEFDMNHDETCKELEREAVEKIAKLAKEEKVRCTINFQKFSREELIDLVKFLADRIEKSNQAQDQNDEFVSIHAFDMLSKSYDALFDKYAEVCRAYDARRQEYDKLNCALKNAYGHNKELIFQSLGKDNLISLLQKDNQRLITENAMLKESLEPKKSKSDENSES